MRWTVVGCVVLAASLALNVYLLATRDPAAAAGSRPVSAPRTALPVTSWRQLDVPELRDRTTKYAALDRDALAQRIADVESRIERLRSPIERWERGAPTPQTELMVRPYMDRVFETKPGEPSPYKLDCRAGVCKVISDRDMDGYVSRMQDLYPDRVRFGMAFSTHAFIEPGPPEETAGEWLWFAIVGAAEPAMVKCTETIQAKGDLSITLELDIGRRMVVHDVSGSLVGEPIAMCLLRALDEAIASTPVPPEATEVTGSSLDFTFPMKERTPTER